LSRTLRLSFVQKAMRVRHALFLLLVFQLFDLLSTRLALEHGGVEANPLVAFGLSQGGYASLVVAKAAAIVLVLAGIALDPLDTPYVPAALVIMNIVYGVVVANNFAAYGLHSGDWSLPTAYWALGVALVGAAGDEWLARARLTT
jgi:hypothetical protein